MSGDNFILDYDKRSLYCLLLCTLQCNRDLHDSNAAIAACRPNGIALEFAVRGSGTVRS